MDTPANSKICVYYDGACPKCLRDRQNYEKMARREGENIRWVDINGQESMLCELGIDPLKALTELHVKDEQDVIHAELDAYILLMNKVFLLKPIAWLIGLPIIRPFLAKLYHRMVNKRLQQSGRL